MENAGHPHSTVCSVKQGTNKGWKDGERFHQDRHSPLFVPQSEARLQDEGWGIGKSSHLFHAL